MLQMVLVVGLAVAVLGAGSIAAADEMTRPFTGKAVNGGTVTLSKQGDKTTLSLSGDFQVPGSPDPHWQLVDSKGTVYLLEAQGRQDQYADHRPRLRPRHRQGPDVLRVGRGRARRGPLQPAHRGQQQVTSLGSGLALRHFPQLRT